MEDVHTRGRVDVRNVIKCAEMLSKMVSQGIRRAGMAGGIPEWNTRKTGSSTKRAGMINWRVDELLSVRHSNRSCRVWSSADWQDIQRRTMKEGVRHHRCEK